ncbi:sensor histidine kinase [Flavobacterium johnsoniae]|jgi:signal transduction histidine kinase|uniref:histidine kinase n=1 Tax=Flavobacterium johnsoniae (strain ATCC 17061 / DSM 2064 / JCM 8514 / BCRC 14874 / CCUG 350202 / NBRC 14942 / NCIMB 11054 / UW101) TaxID=376686 RepID=A5FBX3_FLAJ1|nr:HAMP domain-containing sensor histidine kinase [Flavobacterium johnsoniae]ABQ07300.1 integral membrane sensor signal transduction histidine kinase [Flavobacterium johnsoniae UW101]OXE95050.1 two-component sensor histidine kinase [Flavobacterium johnsoniae UW101]WQG80865.1 HAMP domain-containing sensor histidine kinase [Flavobacterium johnsoniae UW101]SHL17237.1 Signal transduction histidine kinase [Flavobacterium johnsoniae]
MKIRDRFTLISSLTFSVVFVIASLITYFSFYSYSEKIVYNELQKTCLLTGIFYLEKDELPENQHLIIGQQFRENSLEIITRVYDEKNQIVYGDKTLDNNINQLKLDYVRKNRKLSFKSKHHFYFGSYYHDNQGDFVVFVKKNDTDFKTMTDRLLIIMILVLVSGLISIYIVSRVLSNLAYAPIKNIINQVNEIQATSLDRQIVSPNSKDDIQELIESYNNLLKRLSDTFIIQKNFINYVSHEFKTPLTAISGNLEVFAQKDRSSAEYKEMSEKVLENVYQIEDTMNTLMMLSGLRENMELNEIFRVDELVWDINDQLSASYHLKGQIQIALEVLNDKLLSIKGNSNEIKIALFNIIENAVKYSAGNPIKISLSEHNQQLKIVIEDQGKGISEEDLQFIKQTFYRGKNVSDIKGSGIGLPLANVIFKQNNIEFTIASKKDAGTTVTLVFPKL